MPGWVVVPAAAGTGARAVGLQEEICIQTCNMYEGEYTCVQRRSAAIMKTKTRKLSGKIINFVLDSTYNSGSQSGVTEEAIASHFKISRTPVREVLKHLEHEKLIQTKPYHGITCRKFSAEDIKNIYNVRVTLEELAVRDAVKRMTPMIFAQLKTYAQEYTEALNNGVANKAELADQRFHEKIMEISDNWFLTNLMKKIHMVNIVFNLMLKKETGLSEDKKHDLNPYSHDAIIEALATGNPETAAETLRNHILWSRNHVLNYLETIQGKKEGRKNTKKRELNVGISKQYSKKKVVGL